MNKIINIAVVGLGQVGIYLLNELNTKKKDIELKTGKKINIAVVGLGQVGNYLLNELNTKKKDIELKTGKRIEIVAISAKNKNKKRKFKINKSIFFKNPQDIFITN